METDTTITTGGGGGGVHLKGSTLEGEYTWRGVHLKGSTLEGEYTWRGVHLKGSTLEGEYTWRGVHLKGSTLEGEYTWRGVHLKGSTLEGLIWAFHNHSCLAVLVETTILVEVADMPVQHPNTFISVPHWWGPTRNSCLWLLHFLEWLRRRSRVPCQNGSVTAT